MSRILVVDDEPDLRFLARLMLEREGHEVFEAPRGAEALEMLASAQSFDLLLLDLRMPGMSGWEVLAELRQQLRLDALRVIVFSAHMDPRDYERALREGAQGYLRKPFSPEELRAVLAG